MISGWAPCSWKQSNGKLQFFVHLLFLPLETENMSSEAENLHDAEPSGNRLKPNLSDSEHAHIHNFYLSKHQIMESSEKVWSKH